jgi:cephalosporin hydroxylase
VRFPRSLRLRRPRRENLELRWRRYRTTPPEYRRRYAMTGRQWMGEHLYNELMKRESHWMGVRSLKNPLDAWVYQEIIHEVRPTAIVELGSAIGGGTLFLCNMLDLLGPDAPVITVDLGHATFVAEHPRIRKVAGDTRDPDVVAHVRELCEDRHVLLVHDASHEAAIVIEDLRNYGPLVAPGSYLIVEDGVQDYLGGTPGPVTAVNQFLSESPDFELDASREKFAFGYNPRGFLRRRG